MLPTAAPVGTYPGSVQGRHGAGSRVLTQQASTQEVLDVCTGWRPGAGSDLRNTSVQVQDCGPANHSPLPRHPSAPMETAVLCALGIRLPCSSPARPTEVTAGPEGGGEAKCQPIHVPTILPLDKVNSQAVRKDSRLAPSHTQCGHRAEASPERQSERRGPCPGHTTPRQFLSYDTDCCFREKNRK